MQDVSSPSFFGGYAKGIVKLPGSMNDSHARVSNDRKVAADDRDEDTGEDSDASPSPSPLSISGGGADAAGGSSTVPLDGNGNDSVERVSPREESSPTFAETSARNRRADGFVEDNYAR